MRVTSLRIGSRKSDLARLQAYLIGDALKKAHPELEIQYCFKESLGDKNLTDALWKMPEKGVFTEDFYDDLVQDRIDLVVHSWKDLPIESKEKTEIIATLQRADQRDLFLMKKSSFAQVTKTSTLKIFSSSPRREYCLKPFLKEALPCTLKEVHFEMVRGNIPTRIRKLLESNDVHALIVAKAALDRLLSAAEEEFASVRQQLRDALDQLEWMVLPLSISPNAAAQGAIAIETLKTRSDLHSLLSPIQDDSTFYCANEERKTLASYGGGCHQKIGVAVLKRPYGEVRITKGLTDEGKTLTQCEIQTIDIPRFAASDLWPLPSQHMASKVFDRKPLRFTAFASDVTALFVSKFDAWPNTAQAQNRIVWTAGIQTWKKLAKKGVWVHGSADGLGEKEDPQIENLAAKKLSWQKLTHTQSSAPKGWATLYTYELLPKPEADEFLKNSLKNKKCFFWSSGSLFKLALKTCPEIATAHHACGPGNTALAIRETLEERGHWDESKLHLFLNEEEWSLKCTL